MQWASVLSKNNNIRRALQTARRNLLKTLGAEPDLVFIFVSSYYHLHYNRLPELLAEQFPKAVCLGCSALGVIAGGEELEDQVGISVVAACLPDVKIEPFSISSSADQVRLLEVCKKRENPQLMVLSDPVSFQHDKLLQTLNSSSNTPKIIGGLASGSAELGYNALIANGQVYKSGAVAVLLSGNIVLDQVVFHGAKPVGEPLFVTAASSNLIYELDGLPAHIALHNLVEHVSAEDHRLLQQGLLLGVRINSDEVGIDTETYSLRNILAVDTENNYLILDHSVPERSVVRFHLRDPELINQSLLTNLIAYKKDLGKQPLGGALLFTCISKGESYYQKRSCETKIFKRCFSQTPIGGFFSAGEYGQIQGQSTVQGHSSSFCFFRAAR